MRRHVLLIGVDGMWWHAFHRRNASCSGSSGSGSSSGGGTTTSEPSTCAPCLATLAQRADVCRSVHGRTRTSHIVISMPSWMASLTGRWTSAHGLDCNEARAYRRESAPTVFDTVAKASARTTSLVIGEWSDLLDVVGATAASDGENRCATHTYKAKSDDDAVRRVRNALRRIDDGARYPHAITFVHLNDVDAAGHAHGFSLHRAAYRDAIARTDAHVGRLVRAVDRRRRRLGEQWLVVCYTDHGGGADGDHDTSLPEYRQVWLLADAAGAWPRKRPRPPREPPLITAVHDMVLDFLGVDRAVRNADGNQSGSSVAPTKSPPSSSS